MIQWVHFNVPAGLVHGMCSWAFDVFHQALGTKFYNRSENSISKGKYDSLGQNVCSEFIA